MTDALKAFGVQLVVTSTMAPQIVPPYETSVCIPDAVFLYFIG